MPESTNHQKDPGKSPRTVTLLSAAMTIALAALSGCGGPIGPQRVEVSGKVQLDHQPLASGTITFVPQTAGTAASGPIADGQFHIPKEQGPSAGKCRVEILSYQETGRKVAGPTADGSGMAAELKQIVPARYNTGSSLECVLEATGANSCEFALESK
ncbi:MAG: hypothetical protein ABFD16_15030 [Thermoguttaceae bacterium]|jgi:hypothetical protein